MNATEMREMQNKCWVCRKVCKKIKKQIN